MVKRSDSRLKVVILAKTHRHTCARVHVILFSSHLKLPYDQLKDYYCLHFQIEFDFVTLKSTGAWKTS